MPSIWIAADWRHMKENGTELTKRNEKIETRTRIKSHKNSQCWECWWLEIQNAHVCSHSQSAISSKNYEPKSKMLIQFDPINLNRETIHEHKHIPKTVRGKRQSVFFLLRLESDFFVWRRRNVCATITAPWNVKDKRKSILWIYVYKIAHSSRWSE